MSRGYLAATEAGADERLVDWVSGACLVARADAARAAGPLDETFFMYCEDTDWCHRMHDLGWAILWCPKVTVVHHVGGSASGSPFVTYQHYRSLLLYFARYEPHAIARLRVFMLVGCVPRALAAECRRLFGGGEHPWWRILRLSLQRASTWGAGA